MIKASLPLSKIQRDILDELSFEEFKSVRFTSRFTTNRRTKPETIAALRELFLLGYVTRKRDYIFPVGRSNTTTQYKKVFAFRNL